MIKFIFTLAFLFFILMSLLGFSVVRMIKGIFGGGNNQRTQQRKQTTGRSSSSRQTTQNEYAAQKKKIFSKDEGEYVDYEEMK